MCKGNTTVPSMSSMVSDWCSISFQFKIPGASVKFHFERDVWARWSMSFMAQCCLFQRCRAVLKNRFYRRTKSSTKKVNWLQRVRASIRLQSFLSCELHDVRSPRSIDLESALLAHSIDLKCMRLHFLRPSCRRSSSYSLRFSFQRVFWSWIVQFERIYVTNWWSCCSTRAWVFGKWPTVFHQVMDISVDLSDFLTCWEQYKPIKEILFLK